jgi:hypothetical protein
VDRKGGVNANAYAQASLAVDRIRDDLGESRVRQGRDHDVLEACRWAAKLLSEVERSYYEGRDDGVAAVVEVIERLAGADGGDPGYYEALDDVLAAVGSI